MCRGDVFQEVANANSSESRIDDGIKMEAFTGLR